MNQEQDDFVIVGSGMGGLTTGAILAKNGFKVTVLEKNHQIGGALQVFSRDKCVFDTGVHYIGGLDAGQNLRGIFNYLGILDKLKVKRLDNDGFDEFRFEDGTIYKHAQGYDNFKRHLKSSFPEDHEAIELFCDKMQEICRCFPMYNLELTAEKAYYENPDILTLGAWDFLSSITTNERLKSVLLGSGPLYAGEKETTPFYVVALITNSYIMGSYRIVDGGSQIAKALVRVIRANGGRLFKHKEVVSANYNTDKTVAEVVCSDGSVYGAKNFISNVHPALTIDLFGAENFRPAYTNRIKKLKNSISSFMVYFSLKPNSFPYYNKNFYEYFVDDSWETVDYSEENWPEMMFMCTPASSKSDDYAESICVMCYMKMEDVAKWEDSFNTVSNPNKRSEEYLAWKKANEQKVLNRLNERFPGVKDAVINAYSSTPLTYRDYIGTPEGALYGIHKDFNNAAGTMINSRTKINNLYLTGQNIVFHGIVGAAIGSLVTCFNFLNPEEVLAQMKSIEENAEL